MFNFFKKKKNILNGTITIPPDKSITHRSLIFGALTKSKIKIKNISLGKDCLATLKILEQLGIKHEFISKRDIILDSSQGFSGCDEPLDCENSGTLMRLIAGLLSKQNFDSALIGDKSLSKRPMKRIIEPLELMGAKIESEENKPPLKIFKNENLKGIEYFSPIPSAQVKTCLMLAGLYADGITKIYENYLSRNHSEIMFEYLEANIQTGKDEKGFWIQIQKSDLKPKDIEVVGDISSAAFFMVAAAIIPNSSIIIKNVGINPTRTGIIDVFKQCKINFELLNERTVSNELCADIKVEYTKNISPFEIKGDIVPRLIDEIPILAVLATQANGKSIIKDAKDLRNKESDRISTIVNAFKSLKIDIEEMPDGFIITGKNDINSKANLPTYLDHRLAMSYYVLSLINKKELKIEGLECIETSFPEFMELMNKLM